MTGSLAGRSALITGGSGAIAAAVAGRLARDGAAVTLVGRNATTLACSRDRILADVPDAKIAIHAGDSNSEAGIAAAVQEAHAFGGRLDIVIATLGGGGGYRPIVEHDLDSFMSDISINLGSAFLAVRYAAPQMTNGSSFVFVSSNAAMMPILGFSGYCAGKAGLEHFVRTAANELGERGIRLNVVRPGLTRSVSTGEIFKDPAALGFFLERMPLGRAGEPIDIVGAIRFLAGPEASWITGQSIAVDGGNELRGAPMTGCEAALT